MSGLFRYNTTNNSTPKRRATLSPFCTSPGQLQDVTMDNTYALGYRSPSISLQHGGNTSPGQGRSVREFEEQMASLRNENFNLKLRLYFLEQKVPGYSSSNSSDGHESLIKQNVDLKVDIEVLKKELEQKQSLLCDAAKALELMEDQQKENEEKSRGVIEELNQKVQFLEVESKHFERSTCHQNLEQLMGRSDLLGDVDILQKVRELEGHVKQFEQKNEELVNKNKELEELLTIKDESNKEHQENIMKLNFQIDELQEQMDEKTKETLMLEYPKLKDELQENKKQLADKICLIQDIEERLQEKTRAHEKACKTLKTLVINTNSLEREIERLKKSNESQSVSYIKEDRTTFESESTALCGTANISENKTASVLQAKLIAEKDLEIGRLRQEVKKKTANLQNLVNKELWEKNREIERLTKLVNKSINSSMSGSTVHDVDPLQQSFTDSDYDQALNQNKRLQSKVDSLIQRLSSVTERNSESTVQQLKIEIYEAQEQTEKAERWRKECADVCSILTSRLEELAGFLDSLLRHKELLGALGADRRRAMRKAVDKSLELSRSLNSMSLSVSGISVGDHSLEFLGSISNILDHTSSENKENRTFNCGDISATGNGQIIDRLQAEIKALKKELEKKKSPDSAKKDRRSLPLKLENQSESEAWSEPDRNVSLARIGLEDSVAVKNTTNAKEEENGNTSTDSETDLSRKCKTKSLDRTSQLEQIISQRDNKILQVQCDLVEADNRLKQETMRRSEASRELEEYRKINEILEIEIATFKEQASRYESTMNDIDVYKRQVEEKENALVQLAEVRDKLNVDIRMAEMKIESLWTTCEELKQKHERDLEATRGQQNEKLMEQHTELTRKYEEKLHQVENNQKEYLARDWISRIMFDETKHDLENAQKKYNEAQFTIEFMRENEAELNAQLIENEKSLRHFKKSLDDATLQSSKVVLERTKALSEKLHLETQLQQLTAEVESLRSEKEHILATNTLLNSKLTSATIVPGKMTKQSSNGSDLSQSGYTSEEVPIIGGHGRRGGALRSDNSSPDLGIESDAGRTSSADTAASAKSQAPSMLRSKEQLHQFATNDVCHDTISSTDNTNAQNSQIDITNNNSNTAEKQEQVVSTSGHDCAKVDQENAELRRKLIRTKRALEDTWSNLRAANQRKEQIERDIRQQIVKTQNVLKNVRTNMESELVSPKNN